MSLHKKCRLILFCMLCTLCCAAATLKAETPLKILFIGNSFTNYGDIPHVVQALAADAGWAAPDVTNVAVNGQSLNFHRYNANTLAAIDGGGWDYVVLQEYSTKPTDNVGPASVFKDDATFLYDRVKASSPAAQIILYETWARHEDHSIYPGTFTDRTQMQTQLNYHYNDCADNYIPNNSTSAVTTDVTVAPAGECWHANYLDQNLMLHGGDLYHAGYRGDYLSSMAIYSTIYHRMVAGLSPQLGVSPEDATYLQTICDTVTGETIPQVGLPNSIQSGDIIYIDFGDASTVTPGNCNNITSTYGRIYNAINDNGEFTRVDIEITDRFNGVDPNGTQTPHPALELPQETTRDSFYGNDVLFDGRIEPTAQIVISDLDPSMSYGLSFFASRMGVSDNCQTQYTISGKDTFIETLYLNPANNTDADVQTRPIQPTVEGDITIDIQKGPGNNNSYGFIYLGSITIEAFCGGGDVNCDDKVQLIDLQTIAQNWLDKTGLVDWDEGDINMDGNIDLSDMAQLSANWLIDHGLMGYWKLDGDTADSSSYDRVGTLYGNPVWDPNGRINGALKLDGDGDYVKIISYKGISGANSRTVCAWIKTNSGDEILSWGGDGDGEKWVFRVRPEGQIRLGVGGGGIIGSTIVNDGFWHHVAAVLLNDGTPDANDIKLYVDGIEESTTSTSQTINTAISYKVKIGVFGSSLRYFNGLIDDVRIYNRALSEEEIDILAD